MYQGAKLRQSAAGRPSAECQHRHRQAAVPPRRDGAVHACRSPAPMASLCRGAEFSLGVVDEAIYAIRRDMTQDPLAFFFGTRVEYGAHRGLAQLTISTARPASAACGWRRCASPSRLAQLKPDRMVQPKIRKAFPDTAFWAADLVTDAAGKAQAKVEFPDSLTTWRATARGVTRRYARRRRHAEDHRAQEPDPAPGRAALLRAGRRGRDLGAGAQLPDHRKDGACLARPQGPGRAGRRHTRCPRACRAPRCAWIGGCARSRCAAPSSPARRSPMKRATRWSSSCRSTFPA